MRVLLGSIAVLIAALAAGTGHAQDAPKADGIFVTVNNPITEGGISQIKSTVDTAKNAPKQNIKTVVFNFNPEGKDAATESFALAQELAKYIRSLTQNGVTTIAFVQGKTTRHTVLPAIACDELVMSSDARIGDVWSKDKPLDLDEQQYYQKIAGTARAGPVSKMFDKDVKLVTAKYKGGTIYPDLRKVEAKDPSVADVQVTNVTPIAKWPGIALIGVEDAISFKLCARSCNTLEDVREAYGLSLASIKADPLRNKAMKPVRVMIEGTIDVALKEKVERQIKTAKARNENTFFFVIETTGSGDASAARGLADSLLQLGKDEDYPARTIAFIPGKAPDLAIFLALACQEIVMYQGPPGGEGEAVIGDFAAIVGNAQQPKRGNSEFVHRNLSDFATQTGFSNLLVDGMFNSDLVIIRARDDKGDRRLMSEDELKGLADKGWVRESVVKNKGELLKLSASRAKNLRIAKTIDNKDVSEVYALYGIDPHEVRSAEPSWLDNFAAFLRRTEVSIFLVIIGIAGLVLELKAPGLIVPGVIAAICFILFFWAQTQLGGQLIYLAIMLFLLGLALVGIEIFLIPGFGVTGVSGILLILTGLVLAGLDKAPESSGDWAYIIRKLLIYGLTMAGSFVLAFILSRYLPKIPYANRLMLVPPEDRVESDDPSPLPGVESAMTMLGQVGAATSMLRPAGTAKFGDRYIDVVTEGDFISPGTPIQVVEVEGTRIVVKRV